LWIESEILKVVLMWSLANSSEGAFNRSSPVCLSDLDALRVGSMKSPIQQRFVTLHGQDQQDLWLY
jgi:hypothetical protein